MEAFLELLFGIAETMIDSTRFKRAKNRILAFTILNILVFLVLEIIFLISIVNLDRQESTAGIVVFCVIAAGVGIFGTIYIIIGHRRGWKRKQ